MDTRVFGLLLYQSPDKNTKLIRPPFLAFVRLAILGERLYILGFPDPFGPNGSADAHNNTMSKPSPTQQSHRSGGLSVPPHARDVVQGASLEASLTDPIRPHFSSLTPAYSSRGSSPKEPSQLKLSERSAKYKDTGDHSLLPAALLPYRYVMLCRAAHLPYLHQGKVVKPSCADGTVVGLRKKPRYDVTIPHCLRKNNVLVTAVIPAYSSPQGVRAGSLPKPLNNTRRRKPRVGRVLSSCK